MRNETNLGFAAACNQGILVANGEYLVLLNNDTMVPPRWAERLLNHLQACYVPDPNIGMVGPSLSRAGGVQECPAQYATYEEFCQVAGKRAVEYEGQSEEVPLLSGTCLMLPARVVREVGLLDERFFPGMFEDNDYCLRVRMAGYTLRWATDVFVHHEACQGFRQLAEPYEDILARNQARFREKWALGRYGI
jgi:GT2 family glycosyltransferase